MKTCPSCRHENGDDARFCSACGTALDFPSPREERKVVTCLFCDLVGFTARAERMDPEDVRRLLQPYHARLRAELERFGGTVEKFIGDAVMAVFGAPVAHEDDPERAVRAALSIRELLAEDGGLEVRIGITTGEALVALDARPDAGEGMASGDVVNTAARLQAAAPTNGILVDETTYRATERAIEYADPTEVDAKGKAEPVRVWEAVRARARVSVERVRGAPLVGRRQELTLLRETLARVVREREPQLVTLVGVPGIGKSRLVYELFHTIESGDFGLVFWRHGRSLPYGEGITFWALCEIVKAQAGILESDTLEQTADKLRQAVERFVPEPADAAWIERHLKPLAGLESEEGSGDHRDEAFAAWRRYLEAVADERPLVLVFEDLHWADDALLDFIDHLVDWAIGVPLLVLGTARPELITRRPGWGGGKVNSSTLRLTPLTEEETAALVHALLGRSAIEADLQAHLLRHAGGNPLYAEEFTRMLSDRPGDALLPETVQGLIAARLDTLPREQKELLCDAAVIGRSFWFGALGPERWTLEERLHELERAEFVRRERRSSVAGEVEYSFRHALMRDVAYEQVPRAHRAEKHCRTAEWIESLGRSEDHAEMLAHHYGAALEYARATGAETGPFEDRARVAFREAGDRASALHGFRQASLFYERALELSPEGARADLLLRYGRALSLMADDRSSNVLQQAAAQLIGAGDREAAAEAHAYLTEAMQAQGQRDRAYEHIEQALGLVRETPSSPAKARVLTESSRLLAIGGRADEAIEIAREAFGMAERLGLVELAARALNNVAVAKTRFGDYQGAIADFEGSIELAASVNSPEAGRGYHNLVTPLWHLGELQRAVRAVEEGLQIVERLGEVRMTRASRSLLCWLRYFTGSWDRAMEGAEAIIAECEAGAPMYFEYQPRIVRARISLARGGSDELVLEDIGRAVEVGHAVKDPQAVLQTLSHSTVVYAEMDRIEQARATAAKLVEVLPVGSVGTEVLGASEFAWVAGVLDSANVFRRAFFAANVGAAWREPYEAVLDRDFARAAPLFAALGFVDEGYARFQAGVALLAQDRIADAETQVRGAIALWAALRATRYIAQAEGALTSAGLEIPA